MTFSDVGSDAGATYATSDTDSMTATTVAPGTDHDTEDFDDSDDDPPELVDSGDD